MFDFIVNKILFRLAVFLLLLETYNLVFHGAVPSIRTAPAIRKKFIELLRKDFEARKPASYTIIDLGSGNGSLTRAIARAMPEAKVIGLDIARASITWSNFMKRRARLGNLEYRRVNFLTYDFSGADAVVMYLIPALMGSIGKKLHDEARPGTLILSNKFKLGAGWQPLEKLAVKTLYLHQKNMFVYRA